jgi:hypothetical protein
MGWRPVFVQITVLRIEKSLHMIDNAMNNAANNAKSAEEAPSVTEGLDEEIPTHSADGRELSPAARRALAEAAARRKAEAQAQAAAASGEQGGPKGPEPTRYGDWERKGIAVDF